MNTNERGAAGVLTLTGVVTFVALTGWAVSTSHLVFELVESTSVSDLPILDAVTRLR